MSGNQPSFKTMGRMFTFLKFIDLLVRFSKASYGTAADMVDLGSPSQNLILAEMICLLLERMELSKGFVNIEKKTYRPHTSKLTLLPSRAIIQQINYAKSQAFQ
jgi:hypothetical protein